MQDDNDDHREQEFHQEEREHRQEHHDDSDFYSQHHRRHLHALELEVKAALALASDHLHHDQVAAVHDTDHHLSRYHHELVDRLNQVHNHLHEAHQLLIREDEHRHDDRRRELEHEEFHAEAA